MLNIRTKQHFINLRKHINQSKIILLIVFAFCIPLHQKLSTVVLILLILVTLWGFKKEKIIFNKTLLLLPILYLLYVVSMLISPPFDFGILEKKAPFLILPFLFSLNNYSMKTLKLSYKYFIFGCLAATILCYICAFYNSLSYTNGIYFNSTVSSNIKQSLLESVIKGGNYFFGQHFSIFHQTIYFSLYLNIAFTGIISIKLISSNWKYFFLIVFFAVIFQISNKANIFVAIAIFSINMFFITQKKYLSLFYVFVILFLGIGVLTKNSRTKIMIGELMSKDYALKRENTDSFNTRLLVWDASIELLKTPSHFLFGVGVANAYDELKAIYKKKRYVFPYRNRLNAHNQYFQITIETGIIGFFNILLLLYSFVNNRKYFLSGILLLTIFLINFLFESVLNRYSGIICFSFIYCLFICFENKNLQSQQTF